MLFCYMFYIIKEGIGEGHKTPHTLSEISLLEFNILFMGTYNFYVYSILLLFKKILH